MATSKRKGVKSSAQDNFIGPNNVTGVTSTNVGSGRAFNNGRIDVSWTNPTTGNTPTGYKVYDGSTLVATISHPTNTATITGLSSNTAYTYTVKAYDSYGEASGESASAVTATTVPETPSAPTATAQGSAATDDVSWSAPASGGSAITSYDWESNDGKSGNTASTSVSVGQEAGTSQSYRVRAKNANGDSEWSSYSSQITSFSFTPFGFTPFGAFSFTPFSAFGFTPFGAFGFVSFGFTPFGAFGFLNFGFSPSQCVHEDTLIKTPNGLIAAKDIKVGDLIHTIDINEIDLENSLSLNSISLTSSGLIESEVQNIEASQKDTIVWFNNDDTTKFSQEQPIFIKRDGQYGIISSGLIDINDTLIKVSDSGEIVETLITDIKTQQGNYNVYSFSTGLKPWYIAGGVLVHTK
jgi:hypothetical protein